MHVCEYVCICVTMLRKVRSSIIFKEVFLCHESLAFKAPKEKFDSFIIGVVLSFFLEIKPEPLFSVMSIGMGITENIG